MSKLQQTLQAIDALHALDPEIINGKACELVYAENMSQWLNRQLSGLRYLKR